MARRSAKSSQEPEDAIVAEARERWNRCDEAEDAQRKSILTAKQFRAGDQWPEAIRNQREGATAIQGQAAQPPRPCLTIDRLSQPCRQVSNTIKAANFAIDVLPRGAGADDETAELFKGYLRYVQMQSRGESPVEWSADGAIEGGLGWFRIRTEYVHESWDGKDDDPEAYDQELRLERIVNNLSVYCDPSANKPTREDATYMFVTEDMDKEEFKRRWGHKMSGIEYASLEDFSSEGDNKGWVSVETVRVAEYWRITFTERVITTTAGTQTRTIRAPKVECHIINAVKVLESYQWAGSRIPLIPILGEELNVDGKPVLRGIIQEGMDAQRMINYTYSGAMEIFALGNKSPYIVAEEQLGQYKNIWETANTFNYAYLPYIVVNGAEPPHRDVSEAPIQAAVALMQVSEEAVKATTGIFDPSLGNVNPQQRSGKAIQSLQAQSDLTTSLYPSNVSRALIYAGELMVEVIPKITRPGQLVHIIGDDDEVSQVLLGTPFHMQGNQPMPSQGVTPEMAKLSKGVHQFYDLTNGRYAVAVTVGKSTATKQQEGAQALGDLIPHLPPEMAMVATPDYVRNLSFPGAQKIAERLEKALPPQFQEQEDGGPDPALQQAQQQIQQLQQAIQSKQTEKQAEAQAKGQIEMQKTQLEIQGRLQQTQLEIASRERIAWIQASSQTAIAGEKLDAEDARTFVNALEAGAGKALDLHMQQVDHAASAATQGRDHAHEILQATIDHAQTMQQADQGHQQALAEGQQGHAQAMQQTAQQGQQAADLQQQAADLAPEPDSIGAP